MPSLGEVKFGREINKGTNSSRRHRYIWNACPICGKERWVVIKKGRAANILCKLCSDRRKQPYLIKAKSLIPPPPFKENRKYNNEGYILVKLPKEDFFYSMTQKGGYILEHRLVMAKHLGRCLQPWEVVHHKGIKFSQGSRENKQDNRYPENLELTCNLGEHSLNHSKGYSDGYAKGFRDGRLKQIKELKEEIESLRRNN